MRKLFIISCYIISAILLYLAFTNFTKNSSDQIDQINKVENIRFDSTNAKVNLSHFLEEDYDKDKITAVGVIASRSCASCITELLEFSDEISSLDKKFFNTGKIDKFFVVIDQDSTSAYRFQKTFNIEEKTLTVSYNSELGEKLYRWGENGFKSQWVFVNNRSSEIISRILVLNKITPDNYKRDLLNQAIFTEKMNI